MNEENQNPTINGTSPSTEQPAISPNDVVANVVSNERGRRKYDMSKRLAKAGKAPLNTTAPTAGANANPLLSQNDQTELTARGLAETLNIVDYLLLNYKIDLAKQIDDPQLLKVVKEIKVDSKINEGLAKNLALIFQKYGFGATLEVNTGVLLLAKVGMEVRTFKMMYDIKNEKQKSNANFTESSVQTPQVAG